MEINLEQFVECPICLSVICEPITLLCGHSFCRICLVRYLSHTSIKRCVTCRSLCNINPEDAKENVMLMNLAFALRPENYKMKLKESSIEKNSWKQSVLLFRTVRLDIFPFQETILHLHESCDKAIVERVQNTNKKFACCHYSNQHIAFVLVIKDIRSNPDNSYSVTAIVLKNRYTILSISDDPFVEGLKTCILQDLHDDLCSSEPRPWVSLPPYFLGCSQAQINPEVSISQTSSEAPIITASSSTETGSRLVPDLVEESSESAEMLWLHELLRDLVNKYISFRHRRLNGYRRDAPLPFLEPDLLATPEDYSLWAVGILPSDSVTLQKKHELLTSLNTLYRLRECVRLFELSNLRITEPKRLFDSLDLSMNYGGSLAGGIIITTISCIGVFWFGIRFHFPILSRILAIPRRYFS